MAVILDLPIVSLDRMYWRPGWVGSDKDEFRSVLSNTLRQYQGGWIVDGRYGDVADMLDTESTDIICEYRRASHELAFETHSPHGYRARSTCMALFSSIA